MAALHPIPPSRCSAKLRKQERKCRRWAVPGTTVCSLHGGNTRHTRKKAETNHIIAQVASADPRPWAEIVGDLVDTSDRIWTDYKTRWSDGTATAEDMERLTSAMDRTHKFITAAVTSGAFAKLADAQAQRVELEANTMARVLLTTLAGTLDLLGLDPLLHVKVEEYARRRLGAEMRRVEEPDTPLPEPPPLGVTVTEVRDSDIIPPRKPRRRDDGREELPVIEGTVVG